MKQSYILGAIDRLNKACKDNQDLHTIFLHRYFTLTIYSSSPFSAPVGRRMFYVGGAQRM